VTKTAQSSSVYRRMKEFLPPKLSRLGLIQRGALDLGFAKENGGQ